MLLKREKALRVLSSEVYDYGKTWFDSKLSKPFPHFWENIFGSCHAPVTLAECWRNDARLLHEFLDRKYIRFHGIFDREVGLVDRVTDKELVLNFTRVNMIYDGLLEIGLLPFVELGFTPPELSQEPKVFPPVLVSSMRFSPAQLHRVVRIHFQIRKAPRRALRHQRSGRLVLRSLERTEYRFLGGRAEVRDVLRTLPSYCSCG